MRLSKYAPWLSSFLAAILLAAGPTHAAGTYHEDFSSSQANGWTSPQTWVVTSSDINGTALGSLAFGNTTESSGLNDVLAVYNSNTWSTDYTLSARMYSTYGNAGDESKWGNRVGLVFNYTSPSSYLRVLVNMLGEVRLEQVTSSGASTLAPLVRVTGIDNLNWFPIEISVRGSQVSVKVNGQQAVTNASVTGLTQAKIGAISQFNLAFVDDISIAPVANAIFRTGFDGATISAPRDCSQGTCLLDITGTDPVTNFTWPVHVWDLDGVLQATTANSDVTDGSNLSTHILDQIQTVTGHSGSQTKVLYQGIRTDKSGYSWSPQNPHYMYYPGEPPNPQGDLYIRYWIKMGSASGLGSWRTLLQWKTNGDFRVSLNTTTYGQGVNSECDSNGSVYWMLGADNVANGGATPAVYWEKCDKTHAIPVGQWFKVEFFSHRGTQGGTDGRVWVAINGQTYFDITGSQMWGAQGKKVNRIMAPQIYTGAHPSSSAPVEQWIDDYEIWDNFPSDASPH